MSTKLCLRKSKAGYKLKKPGNYAIYILPTNTATSKEIVSAKFQALDIDIIGIKGRQKS